MERKTAERLDPAFETQTQRVCFEWLVLPTLHFVTTEEVGTGDQFFETLSMGNEERAWRTSRMTSVTKVKKLFLLRTNGRADAVFKALEERVMLF